MLVKKIIIAIHQFLGYGTFFKSNGVFTGRPLCSNKLKMEFFSLIQEINAGFWAD